MALNLGKGDITNPTSWRDQANNVPPLQFNAVPTTQNYPLNGDGRYWWNANNGTYAIPTRVLNHFDGDLIDASGHATWTLVGAAALSSSNPKFGTQSLTLNGSGSNNVVSGASAPIVQSGQLDVLPGDFTVECFARFNSLSVNNPILLDIGDFAVNSAGPLQAFRIYATPTGAVTTQPANVSGAAWPTLTTTAGAVTAGATWYHIAFVRSGLNGYLFVNGALLGAGASNVGGFVGAVRTGPTLYIGRSSNSGVQPTFFDGAVDELRLSAVARYTAAFTPPATPFTLGDNVVSSIVFIGDPTDITGSMALTWQLTALSSDGGVPAIAYSLDGGATFTFVQLPGATQGLQSGKINVPLAGATTLLVGPLFAGAVVAGATLAHLAIAITRNADEGPVWNYPDNLNPVNYNCDRIDNTGYPSDTLLAMRTRLMIRLGFSNQAANPPPGMAAFINDMLLSAQRTLYRQYTALHTRRFFRWKVVPGQRFYSLLDNDEDVLSNFHMDPSKTIEWAGVQDVRNVWYPLERGIDPQNYTMLNRPWRPSRFDIKGALEIFPAPDQTYWLWVAGHFGLTSFSADSDTTTLDSELVFLVALANAKAHYGQGDANNIMAEANTYRKNLIAGTHGRMRYIPATVPTPAATRPTLTSFQS